tara:strand:+ start:5036 stop:5596 length:561 start_codon:yes stop_codon:yes gene_type:complete
MKQNAFVFILAILFAGLLPLSGASSADTNTVSSTVVTDKTPPTASAPSIVVNNNDVCRSGMSVGAQTGFLGLSTGHTIIDKNCERIKLARSLYGMGMKVAGVSLLCQDARVFDAMMMSATPCPYRGKIGKDAVVAWEKNYLEAPDQSTFYIILVKKAQEEETRLQKEQQVFESFNKSDEWLYENAE